MKEALLRVYAVCAKEFTHLRRDRLTFGMVVMIPLIQLLLFGYTINTKVRDVPIGVVDHAQTSFSRQLVMDLEATEVVVPTVTYTNPDELQRAIRDGRVSAGVYIPRDTERRFYAEAGEPIAQLIVDGSDTIMAAALQALGAMPFYPGDTKPPTESKSLLSVTLLYNPSQRAALFTVPGLLGVILTMTMTIFTSISIVRERERGNVELLIATPVTTVELMTGKIVPYVLIGLLQACIIVWLGHAMFTVPVVGGWTKLMLVSLLFIFTNLSLGLLISTVVPSQLAAMQIMIFYLIPSILLSGFMFPYVAMPVPAQWLAEILPMTHFMRIVRGVVLRDASFAGLSLDIGFLFAFFVVTMVLAVRRFHQRLE